MNANNTQMLVHLSVRSVVSNSLVLIELQSASSVGLMHQYHEHFCGIERSACLNTRMEGFFSSKILELQGYVPMNNRHIVLKLFYQSVFEGHKILPQTLYPF